MQRTRALVPEDYQRNGRLEARSLHRAVTASALACSRRANPIALLKGLWPGDTRAEAVLKGAITPTDSTAFGTTFDAVGAFRALAPASAAAALFDRSPNKLDMRGITSIRMPYVLDQPPKRSSLPKARPRRTRSSCSRRPGSGRSRKFCC